MTEININDLFKLQELDQKADRLEAVLSSLPEKEEYDHEVEHLADLQNDLTKTLKENEEQSKITKKLEGGIELLSEKLKKEESKLYDGKTTNSKELMSIQKEIDSLKAERDKEETDYLLELEKLDPLNEGLAELQKAERESSKRSEELKKTLDYRTAEVKKTLEGLRADRSKIRETFSDKILDLYDKLRKSKQGIAIALVKDGICQGCSLAMSTDEADKMTFEHEIWRCEHCKRIVVEG